MLTSIPFISEGGEKSPFPQAPDPWHSTHLLGSASTYLVAFPAAGHLTDHLKPRGHSKLHLQVKTKVVVSDWVLKNPKQNTTTHAAGFIQEDPGEGREKKF